jgi:hypothetical protein
MQAVAEKGNYNKLLKGVKLVTEKKLDPDKFSKWLFTAYKLNEISRREYHDLFSELEKNLHHFLDDCELNNVLKRMDWRTLGEFALMVYDNTRRERLLVDAWVEMCKAKGLFSNAVLCDNGMANDGVVMFSLKFVNHEPDFVITLQDSSIEIPDGVNKLEVKYCPSSRFLTYKAKDLESCIRKKSYVLTVMGENKMLGANGNPDADDSFDVDALNISAWTIMTPEGMSYMLENLPVRRYEGYMGNKPAVRVYRDESPNYKDFFEMRNWE